MLKKRKKKTQMKPNRVLVKGTRIYRNLINKHGQI